MIDGLVVLVDKELKAEFKSPNALPPITGAAVETGAATGALGAVTGLGA